MGAILNKYFLVRLINNTFLLKTDIVIRLLKNDQLKDARSKSSSLRTKVASLF